MSRSPVVVMTSGVFDLLHRGHLNILWRSRMLGDILVVGLVADASYKDVVVQQSLCDRFEALRRLSFIDHVAVQDTTDPSPLIRRFQPNIFTHGDDWKELLQGQDTLREYGVEWVRLPYTRGISSTALRGSHGG